MPPATVLIRPHHTTTAGMACGDVFAVNATAVTQGYLMGGASQAGHPGVGTVERVERGAVPAVRLFPARAARRRRRSKVY